MMPGATDAPDDAALVARTAAGDGDAFVILYDRHANLLFGSVVRFLGDREAASEIVQETFLALWRRARQFDPRSGSVAGWLLGIARNRAIDRLRADARRIRPVRHDLADPTGDGSALDQLDRHAAVGAEADPAALAERRWLQSVIRTAVSELSEDEREVLVLAYASGLSQGAIAAQLALPIGTVKSRTRRALARLRQRFIAVPGLFEAGEAAIHDRSGSLASER